ncbi:sporulation protein YqfC [Desulfohalotomaculum tongense]|uniref:sporulation protein YqfC n=1 Tax=Desulforadius tongensis TaxID=1216062 RepID=UPI001956EECE|nr:sporulation protein YqfC [Desulforadius tongensis]MBM7855716.1 sporulation protein YqfC [Desulforadius tongensis]
MAWQDFKKRIKRQVSDFLEIPRDVMLDLPKIVLVGSLQVFIENHRGIVEYTSETVRVIVGDGEISIAGENLSLRNITADEIIVEGQIKRLNIDN